ncbi:MAG: hypothetical protein Q7T74_01210 [Candidatus Saccharibacteria bacterium]|nr:hypothetical protein [Candidatus Saccharibacteria bacterium]
MSQCDFTGRGEQEKVLQKGVPTITQAQVDEVLGDYDQFAAEDCRNEYLRLIDLYIGYRKAGHPHDDALGWSSDETSPFSC